MTRGAFLAKLGLPVAAVAGSVAAKVDPGGEPISEDVPLIQVNAPHTAIVGCAFMPNIPRRSAINITQRGRRVTPDDFA